MRHKLFSVYILTNSTNNVLYTGMTNNLKGRVYYHRQGLGSEFTAKYKVNKLVYFEIAEEPLVIIKREKTIKNMTRRKKIDLINKFNPEWKDLYPNL